MARFTHLKNKRKMGNYRRDIKNLDVSKGSDSCLGPMILQCNNFRGAQ